MLQNLKLSHDILYEKYAKFDNLIKLITDVSYRLNFIDILVILGLSPSSTQ